MRKRLFSTGIALASIVSVWPFCLLAAPTPSDPSQLIRPIASFVITLMPPSKGQKASGWIELLDSLGKSSGFIYLDDEDSDPHVGGKGSYIVTHLPYSELNTMVHVLQTVKPLQIYYTNLGSNPQVFIESPNRTNGLSTFSALKLRDEK